MTASNPDSILPRARMTSIVCLGRRTSHPDRSREPESPRRSARWQGDGRTAGLPRSTFSTSFTT